MTHASRAVAQLANRTSSLLQPIASSSRHYATAVGTSHSRSQSAVDQGSSSTPVIPEVETRGLSSQSLQFEDISILRRRDLYKGKAEKKGFLVATLRLSAHHTFNLELYTQFALQAATHLGIVTEGPILLPRTKELITVLKGPFVHKKAQENFERRHYHREIRLYNANKQVVDLYLRYLKRNGIAGVGMRAKVHEYVQYGFAGKEIEVLEQQFDEQSLKDATEKLLTKLNEEEIAQLVTEKIVAAKKAERSIAESAKKEAAVDRKQAEKSARAAASEAAEGESVEEQFKAETKSATTESLPTEGTDSSTSSSQTGAHPSPSTLINNDLPEPTPAQAEEIALAKQSALDVATAKSGPTIESVGAAAGGTPDATGVDLGSMPVIKTDGKVEKKAAKTEKKAPKTPKSQKIE